MMLLGVFVTIPILVSAQLSPSAASTLERDGNAKISMSVGPYHLVTCGYAAYEPVRYPSLDKVNGRGTIAGCLPTDPDVCRIETDLQQIDHYDKTWATVATGPTHYGPPCQGLSSVAIYKPCTDSQITFGYRTVTWVTIVEDGMSVAGVDRSDTRWFYCH